MLEREFAVFYYFSQDMIDRGIAMLKSGLVCDTVSGKEKSLLVSMLNFVGIFVLTLFLLLMPV
jgi:hypothetical protein